MNNEAAKELVEIVTTLMEMPKEKYFKCKKELLDEKNYKESEKTIKWLKICFGLIEEYRPELQEGVLFNVV